MKSILLLVFSVIILSQSYGLAHAVHFSGHLGIGDDSGVAELITIETDFSSYEEGEVISVSGSVSDFDPSDPYKNFDVTLMLLDPRNNIISISQISPNDDGFYATIFPAQGPLWKFDGDYTISVSHGSELNTSTSFAFTLSKSVEVEESVGEVIEIPEEELAKGCGSGTHLEDGVCVLDETGEPSPVSTGSSPSTGFNSWIYSISFTILIAFAIMIILYLISRASRNKNNN